MSSVAMIEPSPEMSPRIKARLAGFFWLMTFVTGIAAMVVHGTQFIIVNLLANVCYVTTSLLVYGLLRPVNRSLSLAAALLGVVGCAIGIGSILRFAPLIAMGGAKLAFIGFGLQCILIGYLILESAFLPRLVGALMIFGGVGWLTLAGTSLLAPPIARELSLYLMVPGVAGEGALTLWLLVVGVNVERWHQQAGATR